MTNQSTFKIQNNFGFRLPTKRQIYRSGTDHIPAIYHRAKIPTS